MLPPDKWTAARYLRGMHTSQAPLSIRVSAAPTRRARDRVRAALTCPFCRDGVARRDAVVCKRDGCGAVYHQECWDECLQDYGGCAVFGCECRGARTISRVGLLWRWLRLLVAAVLFPPRVITALNSEEAVSHATPWGRVLDEARLLHRETWSGAASSPETQRRHNVTSGIQLCLSILISVLTAWSGYVLTKTPGWTLVGSLLTLSALFSGPFLTYALMATATLGLVAARHVLAGEFSALGRADQGETVISRMARAWKK